MKKVGRWWVPDPEDQAAKDHFQNGGSCQIEHLYRALEYVTDWTQAVDCGAHVGSWTHPLSERFGWVWAFEPEIELARCLKQNLRKRQNVTLWTACVGEEFDSVRLRYHSGASMSTRVEGDGGITPVMRLDVLNLNPGFVKIDVEGFEVKALRGMKETLKRSRPVVCIEWKSRHVRKQGDDLAEAESILTEAGLTIRAAIGHDRIWA